MLAAPIALIVYVYSREAHFMTLRVIQFLALAEIVPAVVILGLQQVLDKSAAGTILAGVAGYVLGSGGGGGGGGGGGTGKSDTDPDKGQGTPLDVGQGGATATATVQEAEDEADNERVAYTTYNTRQRGADSSLSTSG